MRSLKLFGLAAFFFAISYSTGVIDVRAQDTSENAYRDAVFKCLADPAKKFLWNPETGHWVDKSTGKQVPDSTVGEAFSAVRQELTDGNRGYDSNTGRNMFWDSKSRTWKDSKTGQSLTGANPRDALFCCLKQRRYIWNPETGHWVDKTTGKAVESRDVGASLDSLRRDVISPDRAYDSITGENFFWDKKKQSWRNSKTGECICPKCPTDTKVSTSGKIGCSSNQTNLFLGYAYSNAVDAPVKNLHGFNASVFHNVTGNVSLGGEVSGAYGSDQVQVSTADADVKVTRYTYLFGPQFSTCPGDNVRVFAHTLFGGAHDSSKTTLGAATTDFSANAFAMGFGGGVDVRLNRHFSFRAVQADYIPTRFGGSWQNNFRLSTGLVFRFGKK